MAASIRSLALTVALVLTVLPAWAAELVMVDQPGCPWCARWDAEVGPIYPKTDESRRAPLRRIDVRDVHRRVKLRTRIVYTPTFVLVRDGRELDRMEGYMGDEFFWVLLNRMLDRHLKETDR